MKRFKLTKGTLSRIRTDKAGCEELISEGYELTGEVDENNNPIQSVPDFGGDGLDDLREKAISLGLPPSTAERLKTKKALEKKIAELEADQGNDGSGL